MMRALPAVFLAFTMVGCATQVPPAERQTAAPPEQLLSLPKPRADRAATVRILRDEGPLGGAIYIHVALDGAEVLALMPAQYAEFKVDAGDHVLSAMPTDPLRGAHPATIEPTWRAGLRYSYRTGFNSAGQVTLVRVVDAP